MRHVVPAISHTRFAPPRPAPPRPAHPTPPRLTGCLGVQLRHLHEGKHGPILRRNERVLDLGAAPGGWSVYALGEVAPGGIVVAVDLLEMDPLPSANGVVIRGDIRERRTMLEVQRALGYVGTEAEAEGQDETGWGGEGEAAAMELKPSMQLLDDSVDVILSDMAPNTTGDRNTDHYRSMDLCHIVLDCAELLLAENGTALMKIFRGGDEPELVDRARTLFREVKVVKPPSSRAESREAFLMARGFR